MKKAIILLMVMLLFASTFVIADSDDNETAENSDDVDEVGEQAAITAGPLAAEKFAAQEESAEPEVEIEIEEERKGRERERIKRKIKVKNGELEVEVERRLGEVREKLKLKVKAQNNSELREIIKLKAEELNLSIGQVKKQFARLHKNQNRVRLAVHALLAMEGLTGGIGKNISAVARDFNNSVEKRVKAEEKIVKRRGLVRFFVGGDHEAAIEIREELEEHKDNVKELRRLKVECGEECSEEVKTLMEEQILEIEVERERLQELVRDELSEKGIFGWIWK